jgi:hypothetical protein
MRTITLTVIISFCIFYTLRAQVPADIPTNGLKAFWPFSGNANDQSGNAHHGTTHGTILAEDRFGNKNSAYFFDGDSAFISTEYEGILGRHPRAVSFWAIVYHNQKGMPGILWGDNGLFPNAGGRFDCAFGSCFTCPEKGNFLGATVDVSDAGVTFEGQESVTDGKWHHYVFQFNGKYVKDVQVYQDGLLLTHEPYRFYKNRPINTRHTFNVTFGALFCNNLFFKGLMDDIAIYDRALSLSEIEALYTAPDPNRKTQIPKWIFITLGLLIALAFLIWGIVKIVLKREQEKNQLRNNWYEQENKVLKAQMDPHFVFNSLNTIQQFIISNDNEKAQLYLSKFSRLIRKLLESNIKDSLTLKEELDLCERYLEIESLRFNAVFNYKITIKDGIDPEIIHIPNFLIQPFIENAIWHGLLPKEDGEMKLFISFELINANSLLCIVDDNGVGRNRPKPKEILERKKSLAINFIQQRLQLMSKMKKTPYSVTINDKVDLNGTSEGTCINIILPILTD